MGGGGRQEVAGGGAGEVLEEGGESTQPRYLSRLEGLQNRIWQTGLVHPSIVQTTSKSTQSSANDLCLSSPRAESARAFTGRRCPHSGRGEDFLTGQPNFFTETAVTPERKVEKSFPMWEINRHAEG